MKQINIEAFDLDDAWFRCLCAVIDYGHIYEITRGSYKGQKRLEFDFVTVHVTSPANQIIPIIPEGMSVPPPTSMEYVESYMNYILTNSKTTQEDYTYGERLVDPVARTKDGKELPLAVNQVLEVIRIYKEEGFGTNQATMEVGMPSDVILQDPPCLRLIDTRVRYGKLHFFIYFRSWDLWGGFPANLGALQTLKNWMASEISVEDGEIFAVSKGLHLYDHCWKYAELRTGKTINIEEK
ncbi:MAG: thymidylate synthase [Planctomycetota bacterium]